MPPKRPRIPAANSPTLPNHYIIVTIFADIFRMFLTLYRKTVIM